MKDLRKKYKEITELHSKLESTRDALKKKIEANNKNEYMYRPTAHKVEVLYAEIEKVIEEVEEDLMEIGIEIEEAV